MTGIPRFEFGFNHLAGGFAFLPVLVGLFAFSQLMKNLEGSGRSREALIAESNLTFSSPKVLKDIFRQLFNLLRSSLIGVFIGALPGAGASISNILAYDQAKKASRHPEKFGTGIIDGIIASESANNGTEGVH